MGAQIMKLLKILGVLAILGVIISFCSSGSGKSSQEPSQSATQVQAPTPSFTCESGSPASGAIVDIKGSDHALHVRPEVGSPKVPNDKAAAITHKPEFHSIDSSEQVQIQCVSGDWSRVQVVKPDYLNTVSGWVETKALASPRQAGEARTFTAEDIYWDKYTKPHKDMIIKAINRIHREDSRCKDDIDPNTVSKSSTQSKPNKPAFYVTCGTGVNAVNVFFSADDVASDKPFAAPGHIDHTTAVNLCEQYAKQSASHPSTVDFSRIMDLAISDHPNGRTAVTSSFTAKNDFNLELKFKIRCLLDENGLIEANINEAAQ